MENNSHKATQQDTKPETKSRGVQTIELNTLKQLLLSDTARTDILTVPRGQAKRRKVTEIE
jgi:hypothetical protein